MADPKLRLGLEPNDLNAPFLDGTVSVEGFDLEIVETGSPAAREGVLDASQTSLGGFLADKASRDPAVAIPAYPNRKFRLSSIFVNSEAGIEKPKDLVGKRVAISGWTNTAGIWARGALQHYCGVDLTRVRWYSTGQAPADLPAKFTLEPLPSRDVDALLVSGEMDAAIQSSLLPSIIGKDPRVRRLFVDYKREEQDYFRKTGIFPISHIVALRPEFVQQQPDGPVALLKAFREARDVAFQRIEEQEVLALSWVTDMLDEQRALMGPNYWAYNIQDNRRALESIIEYADDLGVASPRLSVEALFEPTAAAYPGF